MVAIKDMEMPKNCVECKLFHFYLDQGCLIRYICKCGNIEMCGDLKNKRNDICPLVTIESEVEK